MRKQRQRTSPPPKSAKADDPMVSDAQQFWYLHPNACTQEKKPPPPRRPAFPCFEETHGCRIGGRCTPVTVAFFRGILLVLYIFFFFACHLFLFVCTTRRPPVRRKWRWRVIHRIRVFAWVGSKGAGAPTFAGGSTRDPTRILYLVLRFAPGAIKSGFQSFYPFLFMFCRNHLVFFFGSSCLTWRLLTSTHQKKISTFMIS